MDIKKINFKQPRYVFPLIALPLVVILIWQGGSYMDNKGKTAEKNEELSTALGETNAPILSKNEAYENLFENSDGRTKLGGLDEEKDSLSKYTDNMSIKEKRFVDSIKAMKELNSTQNVFSGEKSYYKKTNDAKDYKRSEDIIRMLNKESSGTGDSYSNSKSTEENSNTGNGQKETDPTKILKKQMLMMDSLEKARDPEYQSALLAEQKLKKNKEKMKAFLNSTLRVNKSSLNPSFNSISKKKENNFIKAVIDENIKGYLGSRIRFRLLEDINVGKHKITKGTILYGQISGFALQRVNLNVISILNNGEILPINLSVFDIDGMQGLYVPQSDFREMLREMGSNSVQGTTMDSGGKGFYTSIASSLFSSTSKTISSMIRQNKAKLKYNSYIYLINDKENKKNED